MTVFLSRDLRETFVTSAVKRFFRSFLALAVLAPFLTETAWAACSGVVASDRARLWRAAAAAEESVAISFLGHASFLIESPQRVRIVTDYNDLIRAPVTPD